MTNFKVGQKVARRLKTVSNQHPPTVGTKSVSPKVLPNTIYEVKAVCYCSNCGRQKIDIGLIMPPNCTPTMNCFCSVRYTHNGRWFLDAINFRPVLYDNISAEIVESLKLTEEKSDVKPVIKKEEHEKQNS